MSAPGLHEMACPVCGLGVVLVRVLPDIELEHVLDQYVSYRRTPCCLDTFRALNTMLTLRELAQAVEFTYPADLAPSPARFPLI